MGIPIGNFMGIPNDREEGRKEKEEGKREEGRREREGGRGREEGGRERKGGRGREEGESTSGEIIIFNLVGE